MPSPKAPSRSDPARTDLPAETRPGAGAEAGPDVAVPETELWGWGRHPTAKARVLQSENLERITERARLSRGLGRAYGDAAVPAAGSPIIASSLLADRILKFDRETGRLRAEAGLALRDLHRLSMPLGWFTPVTPGTQSVTLGGMVAADVHGKNHHVAGTIGEYVHSLRMRVADGRVLEVSDESEPELFRATLGGMGLTGHILEVELSLERLPSPWIWQQVIQVRCLEELIEGLARESERWPMTMSWLDTSARGKHLGRGVLIVGRWATPDEAPAAMPQPRKVLGVPFTLPNGLVNAWTIRLANAAYFHLQGQMWKPGITSPFSFFYVLDAFAEWNRVYGRRGFTQYQAVLPKDAEVYRSFLELFQREGGCSFVTVVKDCGAEGRGMLSFPKPGLSIGMDVPIRNLARTQRLVDALNDFVIEHDGRVYLAKDAFTRAEQFRAMEPRLEAFAAVRKRWDPEGLLASAQSERLFGDRP